MEVPDPAEVRPAEAGLAAVVVAAGRKGDTDRQGASAEDSPGRVEENAGREEPEERGVRRGDRVMKEHPITTISRLAGVERGRARGRVPLAPAWVPREREDPGLAPGQEPEARRSDRRAAFGRVKA